MAPKNRVSPKMVVSLMVIFIRPTGFEGKKTTVIFKQIQGTCRHFSGGHDIGIGTFT